MKKNEILFIIYWLILLISPTAVLGQISKDSVIVLTPTALDTTKFVILKQGSIETGIYKLIYPIDENMISIPMKIYFDDAKKKLAFESIVSYDTIVTNEYSELGQLRMKKKYLKRIELGDYVCVYQESYCENGQLILKSFENLWLFYPKNLEQHIINYYCNGNKRNEFTSTNGIFNGSYTTWHENGQIEMKGTFKDMNKIGKWKYWDHNGRLIKLEYYSNNELKKVKYLTKRDIKN